MRYGAFPMEPKVPKYFEDKSIGKSAPFSCEMQLGVS